MVIVACCQGVFLVNLLYSAFYGRKAEANPWQSTTLEWTVPSPPPHGNFEKTPVVYRGAYDYSLSETDSRDYLPQDFEGGIPT